MNYQFVNGLLFTVAGMLGQPSAKRAVREMDSRKYRFQKSQSSFAQIDLTT